MRYSSTLSLTSAIDEGMWQTSRPGRFTPTMVGLDVLGEEKASFP